MLFYAKFFSFRKCLLAIHSLLLSKSDPEQNPTTR